MKVKSESEVAQLCLTLRDPKDCSLSGSSVHEIFQARVLEWGATAFSKVVLVVKNPPANAGDAKDAGSAPWSGRPSGNGTALQCSCLTEEPGGLQSLGSRRVRHD